MAEFDENALISSLREIQAPVLLLWGEDDKWHPAGEVDEYRSSLRSCSCTVIRNAGHLVHEEKPDRIAELVRGFIPAGYYNKYCFAKKVGKTPFLKSYQNAARSKSAPGRRCFGTGASDDVSEFPI